MLDQVQNFVKEIVSGTHVLADTTVNVVDASLFPDPASGQYNLTWWDATNYPDPSGSIGDPNREIVRVTGRDTGLNTLTVLRAQEGTSATDKNTVGATYLLALTPTKKNQDDIAKILNPASSSDPASLDLHEDTDNGTNKITITAPSAVSSDKVLTLPDTTDIIATNEILYYGMARQAIMNGNFDVWQRNTTQVLIDALILFCADRWRDFIADDGGTLPTLGRSRQLLTSGDIPNAFYYSRINTNGAGTSLGVNSQGNYAQPIENGTRKLCGLNKKVTVSFWARSDIASKRISLTLAQSYGTGGSQSATEYIKSTPITLTSTWTKYTVTFTTNTLVGKTFGTAGDDILELKFYYMWGTTFGNTYVQTGVTAETFVGSGNIDIAQVQLCAGDVALPFQPKSYEEELRACQRYCEVFAPTTAAAAFATGGTQTTTTGIVMLPLRVTKRIIPTTTYSAASGFVFRDIGTTTLNAISTSVEGIDSIAINIGAASGFTAGNGGYLRSAAGAASIIVSAEL